MRRDRDTEIQPCDDAGREQSDAATSQGMPRATEAGRGTEGFYLKPTERNSVSECWPPELEENKFLLPYATESVVFHCGSPRKLIYSLRGRGMRVEIFSLTETPQHIAPERHSCGSQIDLDLNLSSDAF